MALTIICTIQRLGLKVDIIVPDVGDQLHTRMWNITGEYELQKGTVFVPEFKR